MNIHHHWHPVLLASDLGSEVVAVRLGGVELVVFRAGDGRLGALRDECPHRRMRLSEGRVVDGRLECPYHGWCWAADGTGQSPGNPRLKVHADAWEVALHHGIVWVRRGGGGLPLPSIDAEGYEPVGAFRHRAAAPLEAALDNFCEVEHTPTTHALFGYDPARMGEVEVETTSGEDWVRVQNVGPQKPLPWLVRTLFGLRAGDHFIDDWTTRFSPVHCVYDQWWRDPGAGTPRADRLRIFVFFTPVDATTTELFTLAFARSNRVQLPGMGALSHVVLRSLIDREVRLDVAMLGQLADSRPELDGLRLGRFDKALGLNRQRINRLYLGGPG